MVNAELEFIADLSIESHQRDAFGWLVTFRVPTVDDVGDHLDNGKGLTTACDGFDDEMAAWIVGPIDTRELFLGKVG